MANERTFFAYKARNRADGICLIERINLPDRRIVIACSEIEGNPGQSTTNSIEFVCFQVCERFGIAPDRLVWIDHYERHGKDEWSLVEFAAMPPRRPFEGPTWEPMDAQTWADLRLRPRRRHFTMCNADQEAVPLAYRRAV